MTQHLILDGFMLKPIVNLIDLDEETSEPIQLGEQKVRLSELSTFATDQWPAMWDSLKQQVATAVKAKEEMDKPKPPRATRRSAKASGPAIKGLQGMKDVPVTPVKKAAPRGRPARKK